MITISEESVRAALDEEIDSLNLRLRGVYAGGEKLDDKEKEEIYESV